MFEHAAMKALEEALASHDVTTAQCPSISGRDILLFEFVQLAAQGDMGWDETFPLRRRQWSRMIVGGMEIVHSSSRARGPRHRAAASGRPGTLVFNQKWGPEGHGCAPLCNSGVASLTIAWP
jgi:hypothetical protein